MTETKLLTGAEARALFEAKTLDYAQLGFLCGLEIHQQLNTRKLFSLCPSDVVDPDRVQALARAHFERKLRVKGGEGGKIDAAVLAEAKRNRSFRYLALEGTTSLVELDEEPPQPMSADALHVTHQFAGLVGARPVDEVQVMRKTVIDGSNTGGFQRTALVATGGTIDAEGGDVGVWTIAVEEDSARKLAELDGLVTYTLDRLGVPLIEVATAPDVKDPKHAQETAARIGALLRQTKRVRRGLGTIRQDLNVSIGVGERVEIKGCQDLRAVPSVIEREVRRQLWLHHVRMELDARKATVGDVHDVTPHFANTEAKLVRGALDRKQKVLALALPGFGGLIGGLGKDQPRLGREFADHAKVRAGVKGVFHSDELPAYGITQAEVDAIRSTLELGASDGFVLCVERVKVATSALEAVADRARAAMGTQPKEVRACQPDDTTRYMRPLPGAARMYPETDVPPIHVPKASYEAILQHLPPRPEEVEQRLVQDHGLSQDLAKQVVREDQESLVDALTHEGLQGTLAATLALGFFSNAKHATVLQARIGELMAVVAEGTVPAAGIEPVLIAMDAAPAAPLDQLIDQAGVRAVDASEVETILDQLIQERAAFVRERGADAVGPLMGPAMGVLRGKVDGSKLNGMLRQAIAKFLDS